MQTITGDVIDNVVVRRDKSPLTKEQKLQKLEDAFSMGCSDREACLLAGISMATLYNWQKQDKRLLERKELLKQNPIAVARASMMKHIPRDGDLALKFLERVKKDEFSLRTELTGNNGEPLSFTWVAPTEEA